MMCRFCPQCKYSNLATHFPYIISPTAIHQASFPVAKLRITSKELLCSYSTEWSFCSVFPYSIRWYGVSPQSGPCFHLRGRIAHGSSVSRWHNISHHPSMSGTKKPVLFHWNRCSPGFHKFCRNRNRDFKAVNKRCRHWTHFELCK
jgi:hypothetical protein